MRQNNNAYSRWENSWCFLFSRVFLRSSHTSTWSVSASIEPASPHLHLATLCSVQPVNPDLPVINPFFALLYSSPFSLTPYHLFCLILHLSSTLIPNITRDHFSLDPRLFTKHGKPGVARLLSLCACVLAVALSCVSSGRQHMALGQIPGSQAENEWTHCPELPRPRRPLARMASSGPISS